MSPSIHNDTTYDKFSNTGYVVDVPSIAIKWEDYAIKDGGESLNIQHRRSIKQTLK